MDGEGRHRRTKPLIWGLFLIALGAAFLLDRFGVLDLPPVGRLWPLVFFVIGIGHLADRRPGSALTMFLMGAWFMACNEGWMGFDYGNSWPLLLVAIGVGMVVKALTREVGRRHREGDAS